LLNHDDIWREKVIKDDLYQCYIDDLKDQGRAFRLSRIMFGKFLNRALPPEYPRITQDWMDVPFTDQNTGWTGKKRRRVYVYCMPDLAKAREFWDKNFGGPFDWPRNEPVQQEVSEAPEARPF
jgi:hypothetical protein